MVEYNFSSDTTQDKNDGSQYGELQLSLLTLKKIKLTGIQYGALQFQFRHKTTEWQQGWRNKISIVTLNKIKINYNQSGVLQYQY